MTRHDMVPTMKMDKRMIQIDERRLSLSALLIMHGLLAIVNTS